LSAYRQSDLSSLAITTSSPFFHHLPAGFFNSRYFSLVGQMTKAKAAQAEFTQISPRPTANMAAIITANRKFWLSLGLGN
jgi:hypothetical protein